MDDFEYQLARPEGLTDLQWARYKKKAMKTLADLTPIGRTGNLEAGWREGNETPEGVTIYNIMPYAGYVNDGTPRMAPRNMTGRMQQRMDGFTLGNLAGF